MSRIPQLALFLTPTGEIHCEAPSGGGRRKIELPPSAEWPALRAELLAQLAELQRAEALAALHRKTPEDGQLEFKRSRERAAAAELAERKRAEPLRTWTSFSLEELGL